MVEKDIQNRFFNILMTQEEGFENSAINVYQKLVYIRYEELIKNTFLEFCKHISEIELEKAIKLFMKKTPKTEFVWKMANDFRKFVKKQKLFHDRKYLYDLLYFDWVEVEIYMYQYKDFKPFKFSWKNSYTLSKSARLKIFKYDILNRDFVNKKETYTLIYYDFENDEVKFREINPIIYFLLKALNKKVSISKHLKEICQNNKIEYKEAKKVLTLPLQDIYSFNAIK